ncbi:universal stress protein [Paraburkholderia sp. A2RI-6]|uniref:universal stress protein n=2 Tax=unclassified Paraburkholderia TaxID=2615204 RepID=UPI003B9ECACB
MRERTLQPACNPHATRAQRNGGQAVAHGPGDRGRACRMPRIMGLALEVMMYKQILVAVDGSRSGRRALDEAVKIAQATGAAVQALCVVQHPARLVDVGTGFAEEPTRQRAEADLATAALEEAKTVFAQVGVSGTARAADAMGEDIAAVIYRIAAEEDADLVVMGTRGLSGVKRLLLGSVAESFLRMADRPVMLVRDEEPKAA